jgi:hypothetical protein
MTAAVLDRARAIRGREASRRAMARVEREPRLGARLAPLPICQDSPAFGTASSSGRSSTRLPSRWRMRTVGQTAQSTAGARRAGRETANRRVELARRYVSLSDELESVREQIEREVLNGAREIPPAPFVRAERPGAKGPQHPSALNAAEAEAKMIELRRRECERRRLAGDGSEEDDRDRAAAPVAGAGPSRARRRRRLDRVVLSAAEIADLLAVGPPVQCDPWVKPIGAYSERVEEAWGSLVRHG